VCSLFVCEYALLSAPKALCVELFALKTASSTNMSAQTNHFGLEVMARCDAIIDSAQFYHVVFLKVLM